MKEIILIKNGELALKGLNRSVFEDKMLKNIRRRLADLGKVTFYKSQSTVTLYPDSEDFDLEQAVERIGKIFGIAAYSRAAVAPKDFEQIKKLCVEYFAQSIYAYKTFKVEAKRSDKQFPLKSPEISREIGAVMLENYPFLKVDVHNPDLVITIEIRDKEAYIRGNQLKGAGGMPVGTSGRGAVLMSGGIDSPVAAYMMARRGLELCAVHFAAPPYTSELAENKVKTLTEKVAAYAGRVELYIVPFTKIQETIRDKCPQEYFTIIMRRLMMEIAGTIAAQHGAKALVTGESLGQVASQTLMALACTDDAAVMPILRPLIGMDKNDIVEIARKIDTFETSILPYEDCCTVFTPKHPNTKPQLEEVRKAQSKTDWSQMIAEALEGTKVVVVG
ncbi:MAG: tRNA 4-thiouridine(8) synthase ThiI [Clostridia bacterium]|nr:tRNA 4-thiouridine(8) synthase ThiI [Clostridia bacterium]